MATFQLWRNPSKLRISEAQETSIFVGGIPFEMDLFHLMQLFSKYGVITLVRARPDPIARATIRHRGFGVIHFQRSAQAFAAIKSMNGFNVAVERVLRVEKNREPKDQFLEAVRTTSKLETVKQSFADWIMPFPDRHRSSILIPYETRLTLQQTERGFLFVVDGLPDEIDELDVRERFAKYGNILCFGMPPSARSRPSGRYCFMSFSEPNEADAAIRGMNGTFWGDKFIGVRLDNRRPQTTATSPMKLLPQSLATRMIVNNISINASSKKICMPPPISPAEASERMREVIDETFKTQASLVEYIERLVSPHAHLSVVFAKNDVKDYILERRPLNPNRSVVKVFLQKEEVDLYKGYKVVKDLLPQTLNALLVHWESLKNSVVCLSLRTYRYPKDKEVGSKGECEEYCDVIHEVRGFMLISHPGFTLRYKAKAADQEAITNNLLGDLEYETFP
ncbi:hypothetical protein SmJEL517_g05887 [Synchytrium microbalum]|uniref:RRM domain-containing protein n=1 Tax=Synchytrium microbalum TaxID=1806994 RepID=A0A507BZ80_9FUNG|nr:uncharacterized protein SmJEL517_g05887 [Synchytrium microbalum]TPX30583.1 hypothetical protein SmJEL517_g05887 [Synchytrium microbalum]